MIVAALSGMRALKLSFGTGTAGTRLPDGRLRAETGRRAQPGQRSAPGLGDVPVHLLDQGLDGVEALLAAEPLDGTAPVAAWP